MIILNFVNDSKISISLCALISFIIYIINIRFNIGGIITQISPFTLFEISEMLSGNISSINNTNITFISTSIITITLFTYSICVNRREFK